MGSDKDVVNRAVLKALKRPVKPITGLEGFPLAQAFQWKAGKPRKKRKVT